MKHLIPDDFSGAILVTNDAEIVLKKAYGKANHEHDIANTITTKFRIASLSKAFTGAAILLLEQQGKLSTDDPISSFLPDYPNGTNITLHHLLTHTSGIFEFTQLPDIEKIKKLPTTYPQIIELFKNKPAPAQPGQQASYNNSGYTLLTHIIELVSQQTFGQFLTKHVFNPLGMDYTGYDSPTPILKNRATGYVYNDKQLEHADYLDMSWGSGAGGLYSTIEDLQRWDQALYREDILTNTSKSKMFSQHTTIKDDFFGATIQYGYGWRISDILEQQCSSHAGKIYGFSAEFLRFTSSKKTVLILSNIQLYPTTKLAKTIAQELF